MAAATDAEDSDATLPAQYPEHVWAQRAARAEDSAAVAGEALLQVPGRGRTAGGREACG